MMSELVPRHTLMNNVQTKHLESCIIVALKCEIYQQIAHLLFELGSYPPVTNAHVACAASFIISNTVLGLRSC